MTPFYQAGGITIYRDDCRNIMATLADRSVDLVLTDPPYTKETHAGARTAPKRSKGTAFAGGGGNSPLQLIQFDHIRFRDLRRIFNEIGRVSSRWVVSFMDWRHTAKFDRRPPAGLRFVRQGIWVKPNGAPQFTGDRPGQGWESIAIMHRADAGRMRWAGGGRNSVFIYNKVSSPKERAGDHTTAKPRPLIRELLRLFADQRGEPLIFDPFCGSGVVLHMARELGIPAIGCDLDEKHCTAAAGWLEAYEKTSALQGHFLPQVAPARGKQEALDL